MCVRVLGLMNQNSIPRPKISKGWIDRAFGLNQLDRPITNCNSGLPPTKRILAELPHSPATSFLFAAKNYITFFTLYVHHVPGSKLGFYFLLLLSRRYAPRSPEARSRLVYFLFCLLPPAKTVGILGKQFNVARY